MHTPCDNLAYQFLSKKLDEANPSNLGAVIDILCGMPEYADAAKNNNPPQIAIGTKKSRCKKIHLEFTGGTEGPKEIYKELDGPNLTKQSLLEACTRHYFDENYKQSQTKSLIKINNLLSSKAPSLKASEIILKEIF